MTNIPLEYELDIPRFRATDVTMACGIDAATLKNWISRDPPAILMGKDDRKAATSGQPHLFTLRRVVQIAITAHLVRLGLSPRRAGVLAAGFSDVGDEDASRSGSDRLTRDPGEHYAIGDTFLIVRAGEETSSTVAVEKSAELARLIYGYRRTENFAAVIVNVTELETVIRARLGLSRDVLRTVDSNPTGYAPDKGAV